MRFDGRTGTIKQAGAFHIILENDEGKTVVVPTKLIADKEIIIESGPEPETPEKRVERAMEEQEKE
jgi:small-conductance mechanosensitive channel